jgi:hypothetical protein
MFARFVAVAAAVVLAGVSVQPAVAFFSEPHSARSAPRAFDQRGYLGVHDSPYYERCARSSASEGNANQQTRPVKQYGQTSGGTRC